MPGSPTVQPRRRAFAALVVPLLLGSGLAGCLGGGEDEAVNPATALRPPGDFGLPPNWQNLEDGPQHDNRNPEPDRRLRVDAPWHEGDWWYWTSNRSQWRYEEVLAITEVNGTRHYEVLTETGEIGRDASGRFVRWITEDFRVVNRTTGSLHITYDPPHEGPRFLPGDNTHRYEATIHLPPELADGPRTVAYSERVVEAWPLTPLQTEAGPVNASHFRVTTEIRHGSEQRYQFTERWYSPDVRNDAQLTLRARAEDAEQFTLAGYRLDDVVRGTPRS